MMFRSGCEGILRRFRSDGAAALIALVVLSVASLNCALEEKRTQGVTGSVSVTYAYPLPRSVDVPTNTAILITFTDSVNPGTVDNTTFFITGVAATVTYDSRNRTAILRPSSALGISTTYTVNVTSGIQGEYPGQIPLTPLTYSFTTGVLTDTTGPSGSSVAPSSGSGNVTISSAVTRTFSEPVDPTYVTDSVFTLTGATGRVRCIGATAILYPSSPLAINTAYTATATAAFRGLAGETSTATETFSFTTGAGVDSTRPRVETSAPSPGATATAQAVTVRFSEEMDPFTVTTASFSVGGIGGLVHCAGREATFYPLSPFAASKTYTVTVTTAAKDLSGNPLFEDTTFTFTTPAAADVVAPTIALLSPVAGESGVRINRGVHILFSEPMDPMTINSATVRIANETGHVTYDASTRIASFMPVGSLRANVTETLTITQGVRDLSGNVLAATATCTFTTGNRSESVAPDLVSAGGYAAIGGTAVSATGAASRLHGDLGVSPGSTLTGFYGTSGNEGPGVVNGKIYQGVALAAAAQSHATSAYNDIDSRTMDTAVTGTALDGLTLTPGVYRDTGNATLGAGVLTLDARGRADALFVFRVSGNLSAAAGARVALVNGARAERVYWQVGGSATVGAGASFAGTVLARNAISFGAGAFLRGRAVASTGAVSLADSVVIEAP